MFKKKKLAFIFLLIILFISSACSNRIPTRDFEIEKGSIDLREINFEKDIVQLNTKWEFYWKELLDRIRDIRSSEKVLYRQVLDLYSTSIDYDPKSSESIMFFKTVQNKLHYAVNKQTAAETIYSRADAEKEFMGLTSFSGKVPSKSDTKIAKNYLDSDELFRLNRLVSAFFDLAEIKAQEQKKMYMKEIGRAHV